MSRQSLAFSSVAIALVVSYAPSDATAQYSAPRQAPARAFRISVPTRPFGDLHGRFAAAVARAEAEGSRHPRSHTLAAAATRRCVDATAPAPDLGGAGNFTSGEFTAGPFAAYPSRWRQGGGKLWWAPLIVDTSATLTIRAWPLDHSGQSYTMRQRRMARTLSPSRDYFYATGARLPRRGVWLIIATAADNWGCFLYAF